MLQSLQAATDARAGHEHFSGPFQDKETLQAASTALLNAVARDARILQRLRRRHRRNLLRELPVAA